MLAKNRARQSEPAWPAHILGPWHQFVVEGLLRVVEQMLVVAHIVLCFRILVDFGGEAGSSFAKAGMVVVRSVLVLRLSVRGHWTNGYFVLVYLVSCHLEELNILLAMRRL